jgi:APA family basic amino acid/polyamine antiporter
MAKRTLKRQLNLIQVIMLGTAGALGSGIFVLTGLAAGVAGPATVLAVIIGGILSFSIALNYCELATTYPETGGAMTYVREAWGKGLISFLVGSMDCISSTFYTALSAVGFAYSLSVFIPSIPIIPVAIAAIIVFAVLNIIGVSNVGNAQLVMGAILIFAFAVYIIAGFTMPHGFNPQTLLPNGRFFSSTNTITNIGVILRTIALIYAAYVGFEVIADDAEEVKNPAKNIPIAIIVSLVIIMIIYTLTVTVALGTLPADQLAGKETALSITIEKFLPGPGIVIIGIAGMVGALTSINSSMLSATRETFTLSRDGSWPARLSRLNRARVPFMAIFLVGIISILITVFGAVDFLSFITSAGYLFVLFLSNLAMIQLRRKYPAIHRPYKVPLFPLTPIVASATCLLVIGFSDWKALAFTAAVIALFAVYYYIRIGVESWREAHKRSLSPGRYRLLVPYQPHNNQNNLMRLGAYLAEVQSDINMCILRIVPKDSNAANRTIEQVQQEHQYILEKFIHYAVERNVPLYSKSIVADSMAQGIINEIKTDNNVRLLLFDWPVRYTADQLPTRQAIEDVIHSGLVNVGVLYDKGLSELKDILVPVGGGYHCRLAIRIANQLSSLAGGNVDYVHITKPGGDEESYEDQMAFLQEIIITELGQIPANATLQVFESENPAAFIANKAAELDYDLVIIGAYDGDDPSHTQPLFGSFVASVRNAASSSTLVIRQHESLASSWLRRQLKSSS